jgi:hypothetical protein
MQVTLHLKQQRQQSKLGILLLLLNGLSRDDLLFGGSFSAFEHR